MIIKKMNFLFSKIKHEISAQNVKTYSKILIVGDIPNELKNNISELKGTTKTISWADLEGNNKKTSSVKQLADNKSIVFMWLNNEDEINILSRNVFKLAKALRIFAITELNLDVDDFIGFTSNEYFENKTKIKLLAFSKPNWTEDNEINWSSELKQFLEEFLPNFISSSKNGKISVNTYIDNEDFFDIWKTAFISSSFNPTKNYEKLEFLGDAFLDVAMVQYIMRSYPLIDEGKLTTLKGRLVDKSFLSGLSRKLGLSKHLLTIKNTKSTDEDVFESFVGALVSISNELVDGLSFINIYNFVVYVFDDVDIDSMDIRSAPSETIVPQKFVRLGITKVNKPIIEEIINTDSFPNSITLKLPSSVIQQLKAMGINLKSEVIGYASGNDKTKARREAYTNALYMLEKNGMTEEWIKKQVIQNIVQYPDIQAIYPTFMKTLNERGYADFDVEFKKDDDRQLATLYGIKNDKSLVRLSLGRAASRNDSLLRAINSFIYS